jgi:hypothetical protein
MAAVLCSTVGELFSSSCRAISQVICLPCKACNLGCETLGDILCTPMMPFIIFTFGFMAPSVVYGVLSLDNYGCRDLFSWLIVNGVFAVIHMVGCLYIVQKLKEPGSEPIMATVMGESSNAKGESSKMEEGNYISMASNFSAPKNNEVGAANSIQRAKHVLCYDKGMAVYILLILFWMAWICVGINRRFSVDDGNASCYELIKYMNVTITCGYVWMTMVGLAFCCSFLCLR